MRVQNVSFNTFSIPATFICSATYSFRPRWICRMTVSLCGWSADFLHRATHRHCRMELPRRLDRSPQLLAVACGEPKSLPCHQVIPRPR
jgi:hypothetical protein